MLFGLLSKAANVGHVATALAVHLFTKVERCQLQLFHHRLWGCVQSLAPQEKLQIVIWKVRHILRLIRLIIVVSVADRSVIVFTDCTIAVLVLNAVAHLAHSKWGSLVRSAHQTTLAVEPTFKVHHPTTSTCSPAVIWRWEQVLKGWILHKAVLVINCVVVGFSLDLGSSVVVIDSGVYLTIIIQCFFEWLLFNNSTSEINHLGRVMIGKETVCLLGLVSIFAWLAIQLWSIFVIIMRWGLICFI